MDRYRIENIVDRCTFAGLGLREPRWRVLEKGDGFLVQLSYIEPCVKTDEIEVQHTRKWYVSAHAIEEEVVQTCLKALLTSAEHRVREHFRYRGEPLFHPHQKLSALVAAGQTEAVREEQ